MLLIFFSILHVIVSHLIVGWIERQEPVITDYKKGIRPSAWGSRHPMLLGEPNVGYPASVPSVCGYYLRLDGQLSVTIVCVPMHCLLLECICILGGVVGLCVNFNESLYLCRFDIADKIDTLSLATYLQARKEGL